MLILVNAANGSFREVSVQDTHIKPGFTYKLVRIGNVAYIGDFVMHECLILCRQILPKYAEDTAYISFGENGEYSIWGNSETMGLPSTDDRIKTYLSIAA